MNIVIDEFSVTREVAELVVPEELFSVRFESHAHVQGVAYVTSESVPLWFTFGKAIDDFVPTVYTLWKHPNLLPILSIPGEMVPRMLHAPFLLGSDSSHFQPSASLSIGRLVCITQDYAPTASGKLRVGSALAVGRMALPSHLVEGGTKGKALTLLHAWKDELWVMGGEERPPRPQLLEDNLDGEDDTVEEWSSEEVEAAAETQLEIIGDGDTPKGLSREEVSEALRSALLESISVTLSKVPPGSFPITPSIFYETYILPYRSFQLTKAVNTPVDVKHSEFKSLTAFLKVSAKEGLIKIKETKGGMVVTGVDGSHAGVRAHVRHVTVKDVEAHKENQEEVQAQEIEKVEVQHRERQVTLLRKPGPVSAAFFQNTGKDPEEFLTKEGIKIVINQYLTSKHLFKPHDPGFVDITQDGLLLDTLLNGKEEDRPGLLEKKFMSTDEVVNRITNSTKAWYKISTGSRQPIIGEGTPHPISVNVVRRRNHTVTYISGFEIFRLDADNLAEGLKTACASSTAVQANPHDSKLKQIMVQGEHIKVVAECLIARGIQRRWIEVINRTGVKKVQKRKRTLT
ncbi:hypothetical protein BDM02DRAFT_3230271 [Thelephora ganbajun]|uniref:Uncharacterized protein n=1 Tax=Thelephora ganbajun TaxID=370292 RepID=A0ACB6ZIP3_THEGA|nr:hypothetical protein BDM02DRAFT_3230271 [Thelephora ganbajun]